MPSADALIELKCRNCGSQLAPEDISPQLAAARCQHCNALFALPTAAREPIPRPEVPLPDGYAVDLRYSTLEITHRWSRKKAWGLLFFAILWNGFLVVWHSIALSQGHWFMSLFALIHTGIGVWLIYAVTAQFLNSSVIRVNAEAVEVHHGPVKMKRNRELPAGDIQQFYCKEKVRRHKNGSSTSYGVEAVMNDDKRQTLVDGLDQPDQALFLEQQIEKHLGIADRPVSGEHGR